MPRPPTIGIRHACLLVALRLQPTMRAQLLAWCAVTLPPVFVVRAGTYLEEMLLHHGLFDDSPHTRADIWAFCRLRMLRITADLKLGTGDWSVEEAADFLEVNTPMDRCCTVFGHLLRAAQSPARRHIVLTTSC